MLKERLLWSQPHHVEAGLEGTPRLGGKHLKHTETPAYISTVMAKRKQKLGQICIDLGNPSTSLDVLSIPREPKISHVQ